VTLCGVDIPPACRFNGAMPSVNRRLEELELELKIHRLLLFSMLKAASDDSSKVTDLEFRKYVSSLSHPATTRDDEFCSALIVDILKSIR